MSAAATLDREVAARTGELFADARALVLEDEIGEEIRDALDAAGFGTVDLVTTGEDAIERLAATTYDVVLLDRINPGLEGLEVLDRIRAGEGLATPADTPVLVYSLLGGEDQRIHGLLARGADDYIPKPASPEELVARVAAQLRGRKPAKAKEEWSIYPLAIDEQARVVSIHGEPIALTTRETDILVELHREQGNPLSQSMLWDRCWIGKGWSHIPEEYANTVDQAIKRLRRSLKKQCSAIPEAYHPLVVNIWSQGFALRNLANLAVGDETADGGVG
ncbi:MAG: DNA-binding response regulator [Sphingomonadales bacterium CG12_big_fil_rev_8_21_14_0_65_65_10]|uniref:response regulator transcription factor n=1 Tax=Blastomonas marina TaxID=1867408 RepID=UPI000CC91A77|nr:response regulator transcription factor [Blastomonas marina]PIW56392.1 MAG: DNA-binding response regulator [Sphingomonadales bacterium CG12_big_fil_rev_8_21_14_0_65_65_10]WPZ04402.1 response regulator transcription factor [Blastomonas marina]